MFVSLPVFSQNTGKVEAVNEKLNQFISVRDLSVSTNQDELYFTVQSPFMEISQIVYIKKEQGVWSEPELMGFSDKFSDLEPFLSPNQLRLYFASNRPIEGDTAKDYDIWYVERKSIKDNWSSPINVGKPVNTENDEFYPSVALNNNLYFTSDVPTGMGKDDIYMSEYKDGAYQQPKILGANINSDGYEYNAFVSKNEDMLIYTKYNSADGFGSGDLYISKKDAQNMWTKAVNMGNVINTKFMEYNPYYDEEEGVLYFTSRRNSTQTRKFQTLSELNKYLLGGENGLSKIYKIKIKL